VFDNRFLLQEIRSGCAAAGCDITQHWRSVCPLSKLELALSVSCVYPSNPSAHPSVSCLFVSYHLGGGGGYTLSPLVAAVQRQSHPIDMNMNKSCTQTHFRSLPLCLCPSEWRPYLAASSLVQASDLYSGSTLKMTVFLDIPPFSLVGANRRLRGAYSLRVWVVMEAVRTSETSIYSNRPHGAISQKAIIFILAAVRTWNLTGSTLFEC
jgi:hypothetical protein